MNGLMDVDQPQAESAPTNALPTQQDPTLPFPVAVASDGSFDIVHVDISNLKAKELARWCEGFALPRSGSKAVLQQRLKDFSADEKQWKRVLRGATQTNRGRRLASTSSKEENSSSSTIHLPTKPRRPKPKLSELRRSAMFAGESPSGVTSPALIRPLPTERIHDPRTAAQKAAIVPWAFCFSDENPYHPPGSRERQPLKPKGLIIAPAASQPSTDTISQMHETLKLVAEHLHVHPVADASGSPPARDVSESMTLGGPATSDGPPVQHASAAPSKAVAEKRHQVILGDGTTLSFIAGDVPNRPAISFAQNITRLAKVWDDTSPSWENKSPIVLHGRPIAVKLWSTVYHAMPTQWQGMKSQWSDWALIMEYWERGSESEFWAMFPDGGQRLPYTTIVERLREIRKQEYERDANEARKVYGDSFEAVFSYKKSGKSYVMTDNGGIAKRYRSLCSAAT